MNNDFKGNAVLRIKGSIRPATKKEYLDEIKHNIPKKTNEEIEGYIIEGNTKKVFISLDELQELGFVGIQLTEDNRLAKDTVINCIKKVDVSKYGDRTTVVHATLFNGFVITEASSCVDPANYDEELGKTLCMEKIENKIWELLGFMVK